jgi:hypothetical protein
MGAHNVDRFISLVFFITPFHEQKKQRAIQPVGLDHRFGSFGMYLFGFNHCLAKWLASGRDLSEPPYQFGHSSYQFRQQNSRRVLQRKSL